MRKIAFSALLFLFVCLQVFSQARSGAKVYVPPVIGYGTAEDNAFFQGQVSYEVVLQYHEATKAKRGSQYTLKGVIEPYTGKILSGASAVSMPDKSNPVPPRPNPRVRNDKDRREFFSWESGGKIQFYDSSDGINMPLSENSGAVYNNNGELEFVFYLSLINNATDQAVGEQYIIYKVIDDTVSQMVSIMVHNMLSSIPENSPRPSAVVTVTRDELRNKWLFVDACGLWAPRLYTGESQSISWLNFGAGVAAEFHFVNFMSLGVGVQIVQDWVVVEKGVEEYRDLQLEIPLTIRFVFKPGATYMIEPYTGVSINLSLLNESKPSPFTWLLGCQVGIDMGPGIFVVDPRFGMDFFESSLNNSPHTGYRRFLLQIGIGYKFGFIPK